MLCHRSLLARIDVHMKDLTSRLIPLTVIKSPAWLFVVLTSALLTAPSSRAMVSGNDFNAYIVENNIAERHTIWEQMRRGKRMSLPPVNQWIEQNIKRYQRSPRYLKRLLTRGAPYMHFVVNTLHKNNMPLDLALLPVIESGYDPFAYSSRQASGLWQFISSTAKLYGLEENWWYDGRRDFVAATNGAVKLLSNLHGYAGGEWSHALAGYNAGWTTVSRRIRRNERLARKTDFWHLNLPRETRNYLLRFYALAHIIRDPEKYNISLPLIPNSRVLSFVDAGSQIDLFQAAVLAHLSPSIMHSLNAGYKRWTTPPQGPHTLVLPASHERIFREALSALSEEERVRLKEHKIRSGDSLSAIAGRFNTTVGHLVKINNLKSAHQIRADANILVPAAIYPGTNYSVRPVLSAPNIKSQSGYRKYIHIVQKSESLWSIAQKYDIDDYKSIAKLNKISYNPTLHPGQEIMLLLPDKQAIQHSAKNVRKPMIRKIVYTVRPNDSPAKIAKNFSVPLRSVLEWNQLKQQSIIHPGQKLTLHVDVATAN